MQELGTGLHAGHGPEEAVPHQALTDPQDLGDLRLAGRLPHQDHDPHVQRVHQEPRQVRLHLSFVSFG